ncbi:DUF551 domain-containing protein [Kluyvera intermedia]|uniref:DUF551 domain-containing protein n=1 Tax=Kluyvera intermedia TaxID=61648 RepID=UPI0039F4504D
MVNNNQTAPVTDEELDQMIWKLERDGMTPKQLSLMRELREVRRAKGEPVSAITPHFDTIALETATEIMCDVNRRNEFLGGDVQLLSRIQCRIDDACRAAMLTHTEDILEMVEPVSNRDELPTNSFTNEELAGMSHGDNPQANAYRELLAFRRNSPATQNGWIPVSERMPEVGVKVLCFPVEDEPIHASFNGQLWLQDISWSVSDESIDNVISCNVTHWMPLPEPPMK